MSKYYLTKEGVEEITDLLNKTDEIMDLLGKVTQTINKRNSDIKEIKEVSELEAKYLMILADRLESNIKQNNSEEIEKVNIENNHKNETTSYGLESIIEQLKNASQEVNAVKMRNPPKWLSKENKNVKDLISKASNKLAELVIARLLTQAKKLNYSNIIKDSPLSQSKTAQVLKEMVEDGKAEKNRKGRKVFYSIKRR